MNIKINLKIRSSLLTPALLLVAIYCLLCAAPTALANIEFPQPSQKTQATARQAEPKTLPETQSRPQQKSQKPALTEAAVYRRIRLANGSLASIVVIDMSSGHWHLRAVVNKIPLTVAATAERNGASIAVNGGFFDLRSGRSVGYVIDKGATVADPRDAGRLSAQILSRSELRLQSDAHGTRLVVAKHNEPVRKDVQIIESMQAGPALLPKYDPQEEAFIRKARRGQLIDAISTTSPEARTAVGITSTGQLILVCVDTPGRKPDGHGVTLMQLVKLLKQLGAVQAVNFDGGSSTAMYLRLPAAGGSGRGKVVAGACARPVKSVLLLWFE